jgi:predicted nucleic-acid-binding protein
MEAAYWGEVSSMIVLDANYVLRYLLDDNHEMFMEAKAVIDGEQCLIVNEVLAEVLYVLDGLYGVARKVAAATLLELMGMERIHVPGDKGLVLEALGFYRAGGMDFVDCLLCAMGRRYEVKSFDRRLQRCLQAVDGVRL